MNQPQPSAVVIPLRDRPSGLETLLLRRNPALSYHGDGWVFPGGHVDEPDQEECLPKDSICAARQAAVREAWEEAGLTIEPEDLIPVARWTTPEGLPRRFVTWFFTLKIGESEVRVDGKEIIDFQWIQPVQASENAQTGKMKLAPPTFVTLVRIQRFSHSQELLQHLRGSEPAIFIPKIRSVEGGQVCLYQDDPAYEGGQISTSGPRHRLWMLESGWRYEKS